MTAIDAGQAREPPCAAKEALTAWAEPQKAMAMARAASEAAKATPAPPLPLFLNHLFHELILAPRMKLGRIGQASRPTEPECQETSDRPLRSRATWRGLGCVLKES